MPRDDFMVRIGEILTKENIDFDLETLQPYVDKAYPSLRKCINLVQEHSSSGKLSPLNITDDDSKDYLIDMAAMFMKGKYLEARKMIVAQARPEEYPDLYRYFYRNLDMFSADQTKQEDILLIIANAIYRNSIVSDQEINLAATMVEICRCAAVDLHYFPAAGTRTHIAGWSNRDSAWETKENPYVVDRVNTKHLRQASVIIDIINQTFVKNRFTRNEPNEVMDHYRGKYADQINHSVAVWQSRGGQVGANYKPIQVIEKAPEHQHGNITVSI
ncbi:unnamed protein product [Sphagnum tenellum]